MAAPMRLWLVFPPPLPAPCPLWVASATHPQAGVTLTQGGLPWCPQGRGGGRAGVYHRWPVQTIVSLNT